MVITHEINWDSCTNKNYCSLKDVTGVKIANISYKAGIGYCLSTWKLMSSQMMLYLAMKFIELEQDIGFKLEMEKTHNNAPWTEGVIISEGIDN